MIACRTASIVAFVALFAGAAIGACRESPPPDVPALTTAHPSPPPIGAAVEPSTAQPAGMEAGAASAAHPVSASFIEATRMLEAPLCSRVFLVAAKGTLNAANETLSAGDILLIMYPEPIEVKLGVASLGVQVLQAIDCNVLSRPPVMKTVIRANEAPEVRWAGGAMRAHLDVGMRASPDLYLGRLEGTGNVPEHTHPTSVETLIAIEAAGTVTLDGKESRVGPRQIVTVPRGTKHAWRPDPGSSLVAIQLYDPPGPEQRFVALSRAEKDAAADAGKR